VAIGAGHCCQIANVNRVLEGLDWQKLRSAYRFPAALVRYGTSCSLCCDLAVFADMVAIVAAEAAGKIEMPNIVGMVLPVHFHVGEESGAIDALELGD